jgi:hypothetical protein
MPQKRVPWCHSASRGKNCPVLEAAPTAVALMSDAFDLVALGFVLTLTGTAVAQPYDAKAVFYSDSVLRGALGNIAQMAEPELRAFAHYLSECSDTSDPTGKHACNASASAYEIEFNDKRPLDDMIHAKLIMDQLPPDPNERARIVEVSIKYAKIVNTLEQAATTRFRQLKTSSK